VRNLTLPAAEKRKQFELRGLGLREFAGVGSDQPLDPYVLAGLAHLLVVDFDKIQGLSNESREHLLGAASDEWSGGACSKALPNGWRLVILNPAHGRHRNRATLMEEVAHVFLGHKANRLAAIGPPNDSGEARSSNRRVLARDYNHDDEEAAYSVGAAALVPFGSLRRSIIEGRTSTEIARQFGVSRQLTEYRIKVTGLWAEYKRTSATRPDDV
jgi:IrrE N-terminal-like domain